MTIVAFNTTDNGLSIMDAASKLTSSSVLTVSTPSISAATMRARVYSNVLGKRIRFEPTYYIHNAASSATYQNDKIDFTENGGGELNATISPGMYDAAGLEAAVKSALETAGAGTYTVSLDESTMKFTITKDSGTFILLFSTGTNASISARTVLGFSTADHNSNDVAPTTALTSTTTADNMGHWLKVDNGATTSTADIDGVACFKPRYADFNGTATTPTSKDFELRVKHYTHGSNLGDDPRLWADTATLASTFTLYDQADAPPTENEWYVNIDTTPTGWDDANWHYFHFVDGDDATNDMNWLEMGYLYIGAKTAVSSAASRVYTANHPRTLIEPAYISRAESSTIYSNIKPQYWEIDLPAVAWDETSWEEVLALYRSNGKKTPVLWVLDNAAPNGNKYRNSYYCVFGENFNLQYQVLDYASFVFSLRQVVD